MPMEKHRYPKDWDQIATAKKESVGWVCEVCGKQCRKPGEPFDTHKRTLTVAITDVAEGIDKRKDGDGDGT